MQDNFELPESLRSNIFLGIRTEEKKRAKRLLAVSVVVAIGSLVGIITSLKYALMAFYESSFYTYVSILFSDPDVVFKYWQEFGLALLGSLPVISMSLCLIAVFALLMSLRLFAQNMRFGFSPTFAN